jgi:hypothetical protein
VRPGLNKKVLCFVDEYGTAGQGQLYLGAVFVLARDAGRMDKRFSDLLEPSAAEVHAVDMRDGYLQGLRSRFWREAAGGRVTLLNGKVAGRGGTPPVLYANAVVEMVKTGLRQFKRDVLGRETIGNVDVILDVNDHNDHPEFDAAMARAQVEDGHFKGVNRVVKLDSAASRLLQLADVVAYSRKWIASAETNAAGLRERYGIRIP